MHVVVPPIQGLVEVCLLAVPWHVGLVLQKGVPVLIDSVVPSCDLLSIQEKLFLSSRLGHRLMHE